MYKYVLTSAVKISMLFAKYFHYTWGAFISGHPVFTIRNEW